MFLILMFVFLFCGVVFCHTELHLCLPNITPCTDASFYSIKKERLMHSMHCYILLFAVAHKGLDIN